MSQRLHIPLQDLADYYGAGWVLYGPSDTPGYVSVAWNRLRAPVVPFACVSDVMVRRDAYRLLGREAASKSGDGSLDPGRDVRRSDDVRADRRVTGIDCRDGDAVVEQDRQMTCPDVVKPHFKASF